MVGPGTRVFGRVCASPQTGAAPASTTAAHVRVAVGLFGLYGALKHMQVKHSPQNCHTSRKRRRACAHLQQLRLCHVASGLRQAKHRVGVSAELARHTAHLPPGKQGLSWAKPGVAQAGVHMSAAHMRWQRQTAKAAIRRPPDGEHKV